MFRSSVSGMDDFLPSTQEASAREAVEYSVRGETYAITLDEDHMVVFLHGYRIASIEKRREQWWVSGVDDGAPETRHRSLADAMMAASSRY